jgi:hypothetical protein
LVEKAAAERAAEKAASEKVLYFVQAIDALNDDEIWLDAHDMPLTIFRD